MSCQTNGLIEIWGRTLRGKSSLLRNGSLLILLSYICMAIFAGALSPHDPLQVDVANRLQPASTEFLLGTDSLGRCVLSRLLHGARNSLLSAAVVLLTTVSVGTGVGLNQLAVLDPGASQVDAITPTVQVMREVLTILGPTLDAGSNTARREWCINTMVTDPQRKSILANNEDGILYRWDLTTNTTHPIPRSAGATSTARSSATSWRGGGRRPSTSPP